MHTEQYGLQASVQEQREVFLTDILEHKWDMQISKDLQLCYAWNSARKPGKEHICTHTPHSADAGLKRGCLPGNVSSPENLPLSPPSHSFLLSSSIEECGLPPSTLLLQQAIYEREMYCSSHPKLSNTQQSIKKKNCKVLSELLPKPPLTQ